MLRAPGQEALYIVVNAANERIRLRYLHMSPQQFDANGMVSGRFVREGEVIGKVGNFFQARARHDLSPSFRHAGADKYGWVFVNPYMTLVAAYERLIRGRGEEIKEPEIRENIADRTGLPSPIRRRRRSPLDADQVRPQSRQKRL